MVGMKNSREELQRTPRYALRKLSIGLVSCMVGLAVTFAISGTSALGQTYEDVQNQSAENAVEHQDDGLEIKKTDVAVQNEEENAQEGVAEATVLSSEKQTVSRTAFRQADPAHPQLVLPAERLQVQNPWYLTDSEIAQATQAIKDANNSIDFNTHSFTVEKDGTVTSDTLDVTKLNEKSLAENSDFPAYQITN